MDLNLKNIGETEDRISELPDSLLHYILSFLETEYAARTCILSKRWNDIWTSIPKLEFRPRWYSKVNKLIEFVDRTLHLHYASSIQKFSLVANKHFNAAQVHSWISSITKRNVEELRLDLDLKNPFFIPVRLFTCESLITLDLTAVDTHLPRSFCLPKLKTLKLFGIRFTNDCWNEQPFSNCPVLEDLELEDCTWIGVRKFCISAPSLKKLDISNSYVTGDGLEYCDLKICSPSLVSLIYMDGVAKGYDLSSFVTLDNAEVSFRKYDARSEQYIGYGAAVIKVFRAVSHVKSLIIYPRGLQEVLDADDVLSDLPTFHNLNHLDLFIGPVTDKLIFALLKAAPNLKSLLFNDDVFDGDTNNDGDDIVYDETEKLFRHLQSVRFKQFSGEGQDLRWVKLILKNAKSLQTMTIPDYISEAKEVLRSELISLPRASERCVFEFV